MSIPFVVLGVFDAALVVGIGIWLKKAFDSSLSSVEEKNQGWLSFYRKEIRRALHLEISRASALSFLHYVALHLLIPTVGLGLFLHSDGNFLVVIFAVVASMQLFQRVYPAQPVPPTP